jgi:hypothetical protein
MAGYYYCLPSFQQLPSSLPPCLALDSYYYLPYSIIHAFWEG